MTRFPLLAPVAFALALRLMAWCGAEWVLEARQTEFLIAGDAGGYVELAGDIARGDAYSYDAGGTSRFPRRAMRPPLFPLTLAGPVAADVRLFSVRAPGYGKWLVSRLAVVLLATLAVWATGRLGTAVAGLRVGAAAAWLAAVNPLAIAFGVMLLSESLFALLATLSLWGVAECVRPDDSRAKPSPRWQPAVWGGLAAAGAALTRSVWLPMPFAVAGLAVVLSTSRERKRAKCVDDGGSRTSLACARDWFPGWKRAVVFLLAFGAGYAPWPLRNLAVLGEPVLTTTWAGPTLYDSLGPQATGASDMRFRDRDSLAGPVGTGGGMNPARFGRPDYGAIPPSFAKEMGLRTHKDGGFGFEMTVRDDRDRDLEGLADAVFDAAGGDEIASDRLYRRAALDAAFADPLRVARLAVVKQGRFWRPWPVGGLPGGVAGGVLEAGFAAYFVPLAGLAVWGGMVMWRGGEPVTTPGRSLRSGLISGWPLVLTWGPVLGFAGVCLVFVGSVRYRLPGEFPLAVAAAVGGLDLWDRRSPAGRTGD